MGGTRKDNFDLEITCYRASVLMKQQSAASFADLACEKHLWLPHCSGSLHDGTS